MRRILTALVCLLMAAGCARPGRELSIAVDGRHSPDAMRLAQAISDFGFPCRLLEGEGALAGLERYGVLVLVVDPEEAWRPGPEEVEVIGAFVRGGGRLLCAGEAWSWVGEPSARRPDEHPLNRLGGELGFRVPGTTAGNAQQLTPSLMEGVGGIRRPDAWVSEVELLDSEDGEVLIADDRGRALAVRVRSGRGESVVLGHPDLLTGNPLLLRNLLLQMTGARSLL